MYTGSRPKKISEKQNRSGVLENLMYGYVRWHGLTAPTWIIRKKPSVQN